MSQQLTTTPVGGKPSLGLLLPVAPRPIGDQEVNAIDGRALHAFLEVGKHFRSWMPEQIEAFGFVEHQDYEMVSGLSRPDSGASNSRPQETKEYLISLPMAKELAMVQRTAKGKEARLYFIECERQANDPVHRLLTMTRPDLLELASGIARERDILRTQTQTQASTIAMLAPKADFADKVSRASAEDALSFREFAKVLGTGQNRLCEWLRKIGALIPGTTEPYQCHVQEKYFRVIEEAYEDTKGRDRMYSKTLITGKGQVWLQKKWAASQEGMA